mgnify:CR=1 FL=1
MVYAEPHPIFYKYSERREQKQTGNEVSRIDYAEPHPIFYKCRKILSFPMYRNEQTERQSRLLIHANRIKMLKKQNVKHFYDE